MKRFTLALVGGVSLAACADTPTDPGNAAACSAETRLAPSTSLAAAPARSRLLESPRTVIVIPIKGVAITNDAVVAGTDESGAATWSKSTGVRRLTGLTTVGDYSPAGQAVGTTPAKLARRDTDGTMAEIGDSPATLGYGINSLGWVVGQHRGRAFFWTTCFGLKPLHQPTIDPQQGSASSVAVDINTRGDVLGHTDLTPRANPNLVRVVATVWKAWSDEWVEIEPIDYHHGTQGSAINDRGAVAGTQGNWGSRGPPERLPFFWTAEGGVVAIPVPAGTRFGGASDINNLDEVVGSTRDTINNQFHAWVWRKETGTERLPEMGQASSTAIAINDWGDIVGTVGNQPVVWTWPENAHRWR
ncbi:MAG TPA: hypothetical protein VGB92_18390 [Longimicrobium sp.]|jgi:uncharacterized membrane protein